MVDINSTMPVITLNVNWLNNPIKSQRLSDWIKKKIKLYDVYKTQFGIKDTNILRVKGWKKIYHTNSNNKSAGVAIVRSGKIGFKIENVTRKRDIFYNAKIVNPSGKYINCKDMCI